jgi:hypothetical protein
MHTPLQRSFGWQSFTTRGRFRVAQAQFKATPNTKLFPESGMFECGVLQLSQRGGDFDPVSVVNV